MSKPLIKNIKDVVAYLRHVFDRNAYRNLKFYQAILIAILITIAVWVVSGIYFTGKVFNFVTERITAHTEKVDSNISQGRDYIGYAGKKMREYWDEKRVKEELAKDWQQEANLKAIEKKKQELEGFIVWLQTTSYEEINNEGYKVDNAAEYLKKCANNINSWVGEREVLVLTRQKLAEKYKQDIAAKIYWDNGEKRAMQEYIAEAASLDANYSPDYLLKMLKEKQPLEIKIKGEYQDFDEMQSCMYIAEKLVPVLYYHFHNSNLHSVDQPEYRRFFPYLRYLAQIFQIKLDFAIPLILTQETEALSQMVPFSTSNNVFKMMKKELEGRSVFPDYARKAMVIFEDTNQKLAQISPDNMGFKTAAYKYRMEQYAFWQRQREEAQKQQAGLQKQEQEKDIKLAEEKLRQITQARKAEEKQLNTFRNSTYPSIDIIAKYEKKIKALTQKEAAAAAHVKRLKAQKKVGFGASKNDNQP